MKKRYYKLAELQHIEELRINRFPGEDKDKEEEGKDEKGKKAKKAPEKKSGKDD